MNSHEGLKSAVQAMHSGKKFPALVLVQKDPEMAAMISKMVKSHDPADYDINKERTYHNINQSQVQAISEETKARIADSENILQLFPDIELAIQIIISSILSPKDMVKTDLIYRSRENILPSELTLKLNTIISSHLEGYYALKDDLQDILRDTLFTTGSYVRTIIPESIVDELINRNKMISTEALKDIVNGDKIVQLGFLGNPNKNQSTSYGLEDRMSMRYAREEYNSKIMMDNLDLKIEVSDNFNILRLPKIAEHNREVQIKSMVRNKRVGLESYSHTTISNKDFANVVYKDQRTQSEIFVAVPTAQSAKRKSVGRPLTMRLPSESVIPVYVPGNEKEHIGYFVLLDIDGNPITLQSNRDCMEGLSGALNNPNQSQNTSLSGLLTQKAKRNLVSDNGSPTIDQISKIYANIVESDLINRMNNGLYKSNVELSQNEQIYRIMLARSLAGKYTRLLYLPAELTTYFAFKFFPNGVGKSYLDDLKVLTSLRAILLFSKVMATVKNSINTQNVTMSLDPDDPDPTKSMEFAVHEITKLRQQYFPLGMNAPVDLVNWIQRAGLMFNFKNHPGIPQTEFDFQSQNIQHTVPDNELDDMLRKQTYMSLGLSPETVDNGFNSEFATTVISNNILFSKRVIQLQDIFTRDLTDLGRKICHADEHIRSELLNVLIENKALIEKTISSEEDKQYYSENTNEYLSDFVDQFIDMLEIDLPKPDITTIETQSTAFDQYVEALDKTLDVWVSSEICPSDIAGEISSNIDSIKAIVRAYYIRNWMAENGYMPELNDIVTTGEDGLPVLNIYDISESHMKGLMRSSIKFIEKMKSAQNAANKDLENLQVEEGSSMSSSDDSSSDESGGDGLDDMGGFGDIGGTGEEIPPEETTETNPEQTPEEEPKDNEQTP